MPKYDELINIGAGGAITTPRLNLKQIGKALGQSEIEPETEVTPFKPLEILQKPKALAPTTLKLPEARQPQPLNLTAIQNMLRSYANIGGSAYGAAGAVPMAQQAQAPVSGGRAWGGFQNGRIPREALQPIGQGNHALRPDVAAAFTQMADAAAAQGIQLNVSDSYRDYDSQVRVAQQKGLYSQGGLAATPGTSNHGWGLAVDINVSNRDVLRWLQQNAAQFGFRNIPREPWHWEVRV